MPPTTSGGTTASGRFNGMFAFGIYEPDRDELFLARDHLGIKPLYYCSAGKLLAFASEAKAIFEIDGVEETINPRCGHQLAAVSLGAGAGERVQGVMKLPAGHTARFSRWTTDA